MRAAAVHALSLRNDPALWKDLETLLQDEKTQVRLRAAAAYLRLSAIQAKASHEKKYPAGSKGELRVAHLGVLEEKNRNIRRWLGSFG